MVMCLGSIVLYWAIMAILVCVQVRQHPPRSLGELPLLLLVGWGWGSDPPLRHPAISYQASRVSSLMGPW